MTERERQIYEVLFNTVKKLSDSDFAYVLGVATGMQMCSAKNNA